MLRSMTLVAIAVLPITLVGCGGDADPPDSPDAAPAAADAEPAGPAVQAAMEPPSAPVGAAMTLEVAVTDFTLVDPTTDPPPALGEGHFHIYFDDAEDYSAGWEEAIEIDTTGAAVGAHTVRVILVNSLHMELSPVVQATATFTLE